MRLHWTPHARDDLFRSTDLEDDPHIETALLRGIAVATGQLQVHPRIGPAIGGTRIRKWPIAGTAFLFLYMVRDRSEEHTTELQSLMRISYAGFCLKKNKKQEYN